jgi:hypothetical protein
MSSAYTQADNILLQDGWIASGVVMDYSTSKMQLARI